MVEAYGEMQTEQHPSADFGKEPLHQNHDDENNASYTAGDLRDTRDEEEGDSFDDPYIYSDDSASLSDAYFFPQAGDGLSGRHYHHHHAPREEDPLRPAGGEHSHHQQQHYPVASYYGSLSSSGGNASGQQQAAASGDRSPSPLWVGSSTIQEDSELIPPSASGSYEKNLDKFGDSRSNSSSKRNHHRQSRRQRLQLKQRERAARERAVTKIRGKPQQVTEWKDLAYAVIFVLQLVIIITCGVRFGFTLFEDSDKHGAAGLSKVFSSSSSSSSASSAASASNTAASDFLWTGGGYETAVSTRKDHDIPLLAESLTAALNTNNKTLAKTESTFAFTIDYKNVIGLVSVTGFYACVLTYLSFGFMLILSRALIQIMLVFSVLLALGWGVIGLTLDPYGVISFMGFASLLLTLGYTIASWNRIPFAAQNLYTAFCAIRCTADITLLGLISLLIGFGWCVVWTMAFVGIVNSFNSAECSQKDACEPHVTTGHIPLYLVLLFSFHWTNTVIKNVVRVTVASAVGTWWFRPADIGPFCTSAVLRPLFRSVTKSLGSICLGSLVVQPAQILSGYTQCCCCLMGCQDSGCVNLRVPPEGDKKNVVAVVGGTDDEEESSAVVSFGLCRQACTWNDRCRAILQSCNRWSFTYIGMYGYGFHEAGERAFQLFETREWLEVVKDKLVPHVLVMASVIIGGSTGTFAVIVEETDGYDFTSFHKPVISAFLVGSVIGYVLSNILLLGVVESAVNTILVCFAAGPFEFDKNHARLSREMREVWSHHVWEAAT